MSVATSRLRLLPFARLAVLVLSTAALGTLIAVGGCSGNSASSSQPPPADAGPDDACPAATPKTLGECALSPLVTCSYGGQPCQGGTTYYCSGYHWFAQAQVCGNPPPACPTSVPTQGSSCGGYSYGVSCPYGALCDAGATSATCTNGQWSIAGGACLGPQPLTGSPLCGIAPSGSACDPDPQDASDAGPSCPSAPLPPDSGADGGLEGGSPAEAGAPADGGAPQGSAQACRVVPGNGGVAPACGPAGAGNDGAACAQGADCAAGFECVGEPGKGTCRRYCCDNQCGATGPVTDGGATPPFCDIEPMVAYQNVVPVCVQKPSCTPFQPCPFPPNSPASVETCTIVDAYGTTACIPPGAQDVGQSCEEAHCKAGLACWGLFPQRTCVQLCDASNLCPNGETCQSNYSSFPPSDASLGICQ